jgi:hypothetical protein
VIRDYARPSDAQLELEKMRKTLRSVELDVNPGSSTQILNIIILKIKDRYVRQDR